ncbi:MAG: hypothetical protein R2813_08450 [Flavobacteriales bacterium]
MKERFFLISTILIFSLMIANSCGPNKTREEKLEIEEVELQGVPFTRKVKHDTVLFIAHKIADYEVWKAAFDIAQPVREKHGVMVLNVFRDQNDTNLVLVYTNITNVERAKEYVTSESLQKSMQNAGVQGTMDLYWLTQEMSYNKDITDSILFFMSFKVMKYDRWENAFLDDYRNEPDRDFQVINVLKGVEDQGLVGMLFAVNDHDYVQIMEKNNSFRAKMLAAGVISYPITYKLREMPL